ncbi:TusE/DsrC/DsvC family sulfur relay protein [Algibacillus agarilyticus]|uniref:TusE/DsrC/DsvC family sulfur relay protein n=1 Tax=Algibacillus agarilyticus TaxID=2234133 RepID=UPI000DD061B5|nr:TusE/DsrC/DsvC family sulfur relay protein [Algibacillus agarilyticus]
MLNTLKIQNSEYVLDKHGYLQNHLEWNEEIALAMALSESIEMTDAHWEVVNFVRDFYLEYNTSPAMRPLVKAVGLTLGVDKGNSRYLFTLFPKGPAKQATKIAGLPKPAKCL